MTTLYRKCIFLLLVTTLVSCFSKKECDDQVIFKNKFVLKHKAYSTELLISHGKLALFDSLLLVMSDQHESFCKLYSIPNEMKEVCSFGRIGNGAGEFLQPWLTYYSGNTFGINELNKQELAIMKLNDNNGTISISEYSRLKAPYKMKKDELVPPDYFFEKLDDKHYVSLLLAEDGRLFSLLDSTLTHIQQFGESPINEELPVMAMRSRLQGKIAANEGKVVFATSDLPYIASYQLKNHQMQKKWSFYYSKPYYKVDNGDLRLVKDKSFGQVLDLKMDSKYIYMLYLDILISSYDYYDTEKSAANKILVFNHEGEAEAELQLDCRIKNMVISDDRTKLYGLSALPEPTIVSFNLPKSIRK